MFIESICVQISPNEDYFDYRTAQYHSIVLFGWFVAAALTYAYQGEGREENCNSLKLFPWRNGAQLVSTNTRRLYKYLAIDGQSNVV